MRTVRIGAGAGFSGDRIEPAVELAEKGGLDYLVFECLAERTIALAQQARMKDPWTFPLGVEGSLTNPSTQGRWNGGEADPTPVHGGV